MHKSGPENYLQYYDLEDYLLKDVGPRFRASGSLQPVDLWMIFIWKANRAKTKIKRRLEKVPRAQRSFAAATKQIADEVFNAEEHSERLRILVAEWGFQLPMASAILTILYPDDFSVYDYRVRETARIPKCSSTRFPLLWTQYEQYLAAVREATPGELSLRDKDRYLWKKSLLTQALKDSRDSGRGASDSPR
jgi:hypothetical protein